MEQVWFPDNHSDVIGGPCAAKVLANHALRWMMTNAQACDLVFR